MSVAITSIVGGAVGAMIGGPRGASAGLVIGGLIGSAYPEVAEAIRAEEDRGAFAFLGA